MEHKVAIQKFKLMEGEEIQQAIRKIMNAVRAKARNRYLMFIGEGFVITKDWEDDKLYRMSLTRGEDGAFVLGEPEEVMQIFVPAKQVAAKSSELLRTVDLPEITVVLKDNKISEESLEMLHDIASGSLDTSAVEIVKVETTEPLEWSNVLG